MHEDNYDTWKNQYSSIVHMTYTLELSYMEAYYMIDLPPISWRICFVYSNVYSRSNCLNDCLWGLLNNVEGRYEWRM